MDVLVFYAEFIALNLPTLENVLNQGITKLPSHFLVLETAHDFAYVLKTILLSGMGSRALRCF